MSATVATAQATWPILAALQLLPLAGAALMFALCRGRAR